MYQIDQSGKIEQTERQTVIACTGETHAPKIEFGHVGKLSAAHNLAHLVAIGKKKPNLNADAKEIIKVILGTKKSV